MNQEEYGSWDRREEENLLSVAFQEIPESYLKDFRVLSVLKYWENCSYITLWKGNFKV